MANEAFPVTAQLFRASDLCSLAMSLCKEWHFLGIRRYSAELLWLGSGIGLIALASGMRRNGSLVPQENRFHGGRPD